MKLVQITHTVGVKSEVNVKSYWIMSDYSMYIGKSYSEMSESSIKISSRSQCQNLLVISEANVRTYG